jgi:hypothetical protein
VNGVHVDPEVAEGVAAPPKPTFAPDPKAAAAAFKVLAEYLRTALAPFRKMFHLVGHGRPAKCRICNPRGNPPPAPWAADYRRKTRGRNRR